MLAITASQHDADQVIFGPRSKGSQQQEFGRIRTWQGRNYVGGADRLRLSILSSHKSRQVPQVLLVIESLWIEHVERPIDLRLYAEQNLRIARVCPQIRGHRRGRCKQLREQLLPNPNDRIGGIE